MSQGEFRSLLVIVRAVQAQVLSPYEAAAAVQGLWRSDPHSNQPSTWSASKIESFEAIEAEVVKLSDARQAFADAGGVPAAVCIVLEMRGVHLCKVEPRAGAQGGVELRVVPENRYVQFRIAGEGGMGVVYVAVDTELNRLVALKMIHPDAGSHARRDTPPTPLDAKRGAGESAVGAFERLSARFLQEAWVTGGLEHPGIVPVHEMGQTPAGIPYYTMRFVPGQRTLVDAIDDARTEHLDERLRLLEPFLKVCDTLEYAHAHGVIHRDLKPANIALGAFGEVVLLDWGLARLEDRTDRVADVWQERIREFRQSQDLETLTSGVGTPGYMAPEAALGNTGEVDARSDVYSLGVILFEILTGGLPHPIGVGFADYVRHLLQDPAPSALAVDAEVPRTLDALCLRCLSRDPDERPASVAEVSGALREWQSQRALKSKIDLLLQEADTALDTAESLRGNARVDLAAQALGSVAQAQELRPGEADVATRRTRADALRALGIKERVRQSTRRIALGAAGVTLLLAVGAAAWIAVREARMAERDRVESARRAYELGRELSLQGRYGAALEHLLAARDGPLDHARLRLLLGDEMRRQPFVLEHPANVRAAVFSPSGRHVLTTCDDRKVRIWNARVPRAPRVLNPDLPTWYATFAPDDTVVTSSDKGLVFWDPATGVRVRTVQSDVGLRACAISQDGELAAAQDVDGQLRIWDVAAGTLISTRPAKAQVEVSGLAFDQDATRIVATAYQQWTRVWNVRGDSSEPIIESPIGNHAAFSPDGTQVASIDGRGVTNVWDLEARKVVRELKPPGGFGFMQGTSVSFHPSGNLVATSRTHRTCRTWDVTTGSIRQEFDHPAHVFDCVFDKSGELLLTTCADGVARVWSVKKSRLVTDLVGHRAWLTRGAFDGQAQRIVTVGHDHTARVWPAPDSQILWEAKGNTVSEPGLAFSKGRLVLSSKEGTSLHDLHTGRRLALVPGAEGTSLALGGHTIATLKDDTVILIDPETNTVRKTLTGHTGLVRTLDATDDGSMIITGASDESARIWKLPEGDLIATLAGHEGGVPLLKFFPDGRTVLTGGDGGAVRVWDVQTHQVIAALQPHPKGAQTAVFDKSGQRFVTGGMGGTLYVYEAASRRHLMSLQPPPFANALPAAYAIEIDNAGRRALVATLDGVAHLWDLTTGKLIHELLHGDPVLGARFEWGEEIGVTAAWDGVRLWDLTSGALLMKLDHAQAVSAFVVPGEDLLLSTAYEGTTRAWSVRLEDRSAAELRTILTGDR